MDLMDYLKAASETAQQEHPRRMTARDLAETWQDFERGMHRYDRVPELFAEVMHLREMIEAFGAGPFDLDGAAALYAEGQRMLEEEQEQTYVA